MTATHALERHRGTGPWSADDPATDVAAFLVRAVGAAAAAAAAVCGAVLVARRVSGAVDPAGAGLLLGAATAGVPLVLAADAARRHGAALLTPLTARCGVVLAVAALAIPLRATGVGEWAAVTAALAVTAVTAMRPPRHGGGIRTTANPPPDRAPARRGGASHRARDSLRTSQPGLLRQRFERRELPAGSERVRGRVVVAVPAGARMGYGHLGFCPAFASTPTVEVTTAYDGVEATVSAAEVLPWGVRVECRLAEPAEEPLDIPVDLVALAAAS